MSNSTYKRSAGDHSRDRQDEAKRKKLCPEPSDTHDPHKLDYIYAVWRKIMINLKLELSHCNAPQSVFKECGKQIRERLISVVGKHRLCSENQVLGIYRTRYSFHHDLELLNSIFDEYKQSTLKDQKNMPELEHTYEAKNTRALEDQSAALEQSSLNVTPSILEPYSLHLAKSVSNESLDLKINSFALEISIGAARNHITQELKNEYENLTKIPQKYREAFNTYINCTLRSLLREDSVWHWTKLYELYRLDHNIQSDKHRLLQICKEQGFVMPEDTSQMAPIPYSVDFTLRKTSSNCMHVILKQTKAFVGGKFNDGRLSVWIFRACIGSILKIIFEKQIPPVKEALTVYRRYRSIQDDYQLFSRCWQEMVQLALKDTLAKELMSQINLLQSMTPKSYFDLLKITASRIVSRVIKNFPNVSHLHVNIFLYQIIRQLTNLKLRQKYVRLSLIELYDVYTKECTRECYSNIFVQIREEVSDTSSEVYDTSEVQAFGDPIQKEPLKAPERIKEKHVKKAKKLPELSSHQKTPDPPLTQQKDTEQDLEQKIVDVLKEKLNVLFQKMIKIHQDELKNEQINNIVLKPTASGANYIPIDSINKCQRNFDKSQSTTFEKEMGNIHNNTHEITERESIHMECVNDSAVLFNLELNQEKERVENIALENSSTEKGAYSSISYPDTTETTIKIKSEIIFDEDEQSISTNMPIENPLKQVIVTNIKTETMGEDKDTIEFLKQKHIISNIKSEPLECDEENNHDRFVQFYKENLINKVEEIHKDTNVISSIESKPLDHVESDIDLPFNASQAVKTMNENKNFENSILNIKCEPLDKNECIENYDESKDRSRINSEIINPDEELTQDLSEIISTTKNNSAKPLTDTVGAQPDASNVQELINSTSITFCEKESSEPASDALLRGTIQKIIDEYLPSIIPDMKKQVVSLISEDKQLLHYFGQQSDIGDSKIVKLSSLPALPKLASLMNFLKVYKPKTIRMPKDLRTMIFVDTTEWQALIDLREVLLCEKTVKIELANQNLRRSEHLVTLSADGLIRSYDFDDSNKLTVDREAQTHARVVIRKGVVPTKSNDVQTIDNVTTNNLNTLNNSGTSEDVSVKDNNTNLEEPETSGIPRLTRKQIRNIKRAKRKQANTLILEDDELNEEICEEHNVGQALKENEFDKVINDLDNELEDLLATITDSDDKF